MINMAVFFDRGVGVEKDGEMARRWLDRAAETGHWIGYLEKGTSLFTGNYGYPVDADEGRRVLQQGVGTGCAAFLVKMAEFYYRGFLLRQDTRLAVRFAEAAFRQGNRMGARLLAAVYKEGHGGVAGVDVLGSTVGGALVVLDGPAGGEITGVGPAEGARPIHGRRRVRVSG
jgi:uncharacterized protein